MARKKKVVEPVGKFTSEETANILRLKDAASNAVKLFHRNDSHTVFAGGWFASVLRNEIARDMDFFILAGAETWTLAETWTFGRLFEEYLPKTAKQKNSSIYQKNPKVSSVWENGIQQYIFTSYRTREELINDFDFEHCKVSFHQGKLYISPKTYRAIMKKELIPSLTTTIEPSFFRKTKFFNDGYILKEQDPAINYGMHSNRMIA